MQKFTIKDIENMCDIKAHTLRIWEQRYQFFTPKRTEGKQRYYENEDLKRLLRVSFLYHHGWKISKIAAMNEDQIIDAVREMEKESTSYQHFILTLIEAAIDFDEKIFNQVLDDLIEKFGMEVTIANICYPFLKRIGVLWMTNNIIPAQEHFASYLIQHKIIAETDKLTNKLGNKPMILLFTPDGEFHEMPLLFLHYMLKKWGWPTIYLGTNIKQQHLKEVSKQEGIEYIYTHIITNFTRYEIDDYFELLCQSFPDKTIVASGAMIQSATRSFVNLRLLKSDEAIYSFIKG
ncbi:MAG TPA: MerR family transcriptional regulator [Flavisolibacter sp.]|nr:MerR family transcriptional regulator [Flavisolibacter sp.]